MKLLTYTTLYPSAVVPQHGIFVENRLRRIVATGDVSARVVAPVPWFPFTGDVFGRYGTFARIAGAEVRFGIAVDHPRYLSIPKVGMTLAPRLLYRSTIECVRRHVAETGAVLIDAQYFYPNGVAAAMIGRALGLPVVITAHGSDINLIAQYEGPRKQIVEAANQSAAVIAVSDALRRRMIEIGIDPDRIHVLHNGIDMEIFSPVPMEVTRTTLGISRPSMVAVGNVLSTKGQDVAIRALALVSDIDLIVIGTGADAKAFQKLARQLGVADRVRFIGHVPHNELKNWFSAAEFSVLASVREGWPSVLLESMACGTPVIASNVGGIPEIIASPEAGRIMEQRTPEALAAAIRDLRASPPAPAATRAWAAKFEWDSTVRGQIQLYRDVVSRSAFPK
jgi:teichuronic acid biosynthesis glycosyltransferase TuaC